MKRLLVPVAAILVAASSASLAWTAGRAAPPQPVIAVVDVSKVFNGLNERAVRIDELNKSGEELNTQLTKEMADLEARLKAEKAAYDILPDGAGKKAKRDELRRLALQFEIEPRLAKTTLDEIEADMMRSLYLKIDAAATTLAKANGYTIVLSSDEAAAVPTQNISDITRVMTTKRMLYIDPAHDITADLITFMNNEFGNAPAAPAAGNR